MTYNTETNTNSDTNTETNSGLANPPIGPNKREPERITKPPATAAGCRASSEPERVHARNATRDIAIAPPGRSAMHAVLVEAVRTAGGRPAPLEEASALIWADPARPQLYPKTITSASRTAWVQLPYAGIEVFADYLDEDRIWTCGKGVYAEPVAEYVMTALLATFRDFHVFASADTWCEQTGRNLLGAGVTILGGGGIARSLIRLLEPWGCTVTVVRRSSVPLEGADRTFGPNAIAEAVVGADAVVVALALTAETRHIVNARLFDAMDSRAWLVNVARGGHVDHAALADALRSGSIAGAVLDVTDPEPLPDSSELWRLPNCIITPHVGNTPEMGLPLIADRVRENVRRWINGEELIGRVTVPLGY